MTSLNFADYSNKELFWKDLQKKIQHDDYGDSISYTVDISSSPSGKLVLPREEFRSDSSSFLSRSKSRFSNNPVIQKYTNLSRNPEQKIVQFDSILTHQNPKNFKHKNPSSPLLPNDKMRAPDISMDESKSRITVRFLIKKSKRFWGAIRFCLNKSVTANQKKFKSLISSLRNSVITTLANNAPSSETLKKITDKVINTLKVYQLPECMRFRGFSISPVHKYKKYKGHESNTILPLYSKSPKKIYTDRFLSPLKEPELKSAEGFEFPKPKMYECGYCLLRFYKIPVYLKHIRRHREIIRCVTCNKVFMTIISKRRHQLQCRKNFF